MDALSYPFLPRARPSPLAATACVLPLHYSRWQCTRLRRMMGMGALSRQPSARAANLHYAFVVHTAQHQRGCRVSVQHLIRGLRFQEGASCAARRKLLHVE
jgi:hypothetical protein